MPTNGWKWDILLRNSQSIVISIRYVVQHVHFAKYANRIPERTHQSKEIQQKECVI